MLEDWVKKGKINENSVVLVDKFAGKNKLSYMIENREDHCRGPLAKKIKNLVVDIRCVYERGKYLEQCLAFLSEKLHSAIETTSFKEAWEELITLSTNALAAAEDFKALKEKLCISVCETDKNAAGELKPVKVHMISLELANGTRGLYFIDGVVFAGNSWLSN
ncbi:hypothetical protein DM860_007051 [Cuscuta australis]|uniref:Uncharacterized protein n=1 Tax=Cuscuta australis TaxID=267555 RepID=A0A328E9U8_9ASTE|nr:hypothetical protein DM860_007051 [Cuscuta australis]